MVIKYEKVKNGFKFKTKFNVFDEKRSTVRITCPYQAIKDLEFRSDDVVEVVIIKKDTTS